MPVLGKQADAGEEAFEQPTEKYKMTHSGLEGRAHLTAGKWREGGTWSGRVGPPTHCSSVPLESWAE